MKQPPPLALKLLEKFASSVLVGDLIEKYQSGERSVPWFWRQTIAAIVTGASPVSERVSIVAVTQLMLILPSTVLVGRAAVRELGGGSLGGRIAQRLSELTAIHVQAPVLAVLVFVAMPLLVLVLGAVTLANRWRRDMSFRTDAGIALAVVQRNGVASVLTAVTCLSAAIFAVVVLHLITD